MKSATFYRILVFVARHFFPAMDFILIMVLSNKTAVNLLLTIDNIIIDNFRLLLAAVSIPSSHKIERNLIPLFRLRASLSTLQVKLGKKLYPYVWHEELTYLFRGSIFMLILQAASVLPNSPSCYDFITEIKSSGLSFKEKKRLLDEYSRSLGMPSLVPLLTDLPFKLSKNLRSKSLKSIERHNSQYSAKWIIDSKGAVIDLVIKKL